MWRPRDRERFIGSYDPEHEMPNPDRDAGDRWQSDAYRRGARDSRFGYRFNPDMIENRWEGQRRDIDRERDIRWRGDARDRGYGGGYDPNFGGSEYERGYRDGQYDRGFDRDFDRGWDRDFDRDREFDRGGFMTGPHYDRDRPSGADRGWDNRNLDRGGYENWDRGWRRR